MRETALSVRRVLYHRERYACHLRVRPERRHQVGIVDVMTRWLRRCVRDEPIVMGSARVEMAQDFMTEQWMLRAEAYAFLDVGPEHADMLRSLVDHANGQAVEILAPA